jgi:ABC-2 type transport system ATP-binding protein
MAVLLATPAMDEAARCHRVVLLHEGRVLADGDPNELVRGLEHPVLAVHGGDPVAVETLLAANPNVLAASPAHDAWRVVVRAGAEGAVIAALAGLGATTQPARPDFEDLFLARTAGAAAVAA